MHFSRPGPSHGAAGGSGQDPNDQRHEVFQLALYISDDDVFATHTRLYLLRMPLLFLTFQDRILKGLTVVTICHWLLGFKELTTTSQVMSGLATLVHPHGTIHQIIKDMWPQSCTQV